MIDLIKPGEVTEKKRESIPDEVFEVFNKLIAENWDGHRSVIILDDAVKEVAKALNISGSEVCERKFMDVEGIYRAAGWDVKYENQGYNETHASRYEFKKPGEKW